MELQYRIKRSGRSSRDSTRERRCRERNTWYARKIHGCPKVSWETHKSYCGSLRHKAEHSVDANGPDLLAQIRASDRCSQKDHTYSSLYQKVARETPAMVERSFYGVGQIYV